MRFIRRLKAGRTFKNEKKKKYVDVNLEGIEHQTQFPFPSLMLLKSILVNKSQMALRPVASECVAFAMEIQTTLPWSSNFNRWIHIKLQDCFHGVTLSTSNVQCTHSPAKHRRNHSLLHMHRP